MYQDKIPGRQLTAWLFAAMIPVLIQLTGNASWLAVLGIGGVCVGAGRLVLKWRSGTDNRCLALGEWVVSVLVLTQLAPWAAGSWPGSDGAAAVPLILLALAAWSSAKGAGRTARVGGVLFWFVLGLYLTVLGAGAGQVEPDWLMPADEMPGWEALVVFLLPAAAAALPHGTENKDRRLLWIPIVGAISAAAACGVISPQAAVTVEAPFYEMSRSLNLFGIAQRFEALVSAGMTAGWFALFGMLLSVSGEASERLKTGAGKCGVWLALAASAGGYLCDLHIPGGIMFGMCAILWVLVPFFDTNCRNRKKLKKIEKSA